MLAVLVLVAGAGGVAGETPAALEYQIKAGYCYRLLFFTEWPQQAFSESNKVLRIGIIGDNPFGDAFQSVEGDVIGGRRLVVEEYDRSAAEEELASCQLVFISAALQDRVDEVLGELEGHPIVTVSDVEGFGEAGGMVGFVTRRDKVRFEINRRAAERVGIRFRSRLLRLAERIVEARDVRSSE